MALLTRRVLVILLTNERRRQPFREERDGIPATQIANFQAFPLGTVISFVCMYVCSKTCV